MTRNAAFGLGPASDETLERRALCKYVCGKALCDGCPVRNDCLAHALAAGERHGMWGGLQPEERAALLRRRRQVAAATP
ncbi:MAG: WhiB family transcriptional regulator [Paludibaculum sp.]